MTFDTNSLAIQTEPLANLSEPYFSAQADQHNAEPSLTKPVDSYTGAKIPIQTGPIYLYLTSREVEARSQVQAAQLSFVTTPTSKTVTKKAVFQINPSELNSVSLDTFRKTIMEKPYSSQPTFMGVPLITQSEWLGWDGDNHILFQVTGGNAFIAPRMCMVALRESSPPSSARVRIDWNLLDNYDAASRDFTGSWGQELDRNNISYPSNAIWTPYNRGYWELDLAAGTITYSLVSDPGGALLFNPNEAFMAYPNFVVNEILGLTGSFVQTI